VCGLYRALGAKALRRLIELNYHSLECLFYGMFHRPNYERDCPGFTLEEIAEMERRRLTMPRLLLPALGFARTIASRFPAEAVERKITAEWLLAKAEQKQPEIAAVIRECGEEGRRWLEEEARQLHLYFTGRLTFDPEQGRMVEAVAR